MMTIRKNLILAIAIITSCNIYAGGNPDFVAFPTAYEKSHTRYTTLNRSNGKQVADMYANTIAMESILNSDTLAEGSQLIMVIYSLKKDPDGKPITGADGIYVKDTLKAIAVTEKRSDWPNEFPATDRVGGWGYALYDPMGKPKDNDLQCASCHIPLTETDYLFTHTLLKAHVKANK